MECRNADKRRRSDAIAALDPHLLTQPQLTFAGPARGSVGGLGHHGVDLAGDLRKLADAVADEDNERLRPFEGDPDTVTLHDSVAIVGTKTAILTDGDDALRDALDRAERDAGFPAARLEEAGRDVDMDDPLLLATGDLGSVRGLLAVDGADFERARDAVPYLRALRRGSLGIDVSDDGFDAQARLVTDSEELGEDDLPVGPAGELELPSNDAATVVGANRDQSYTTVFGAKVARALFADSRFVRAVERAEKELGISFEDEVLRQFDCPSVSVVEPPGGSGSLVRFAARSCVNDPDRMRELLPRLRPYLPAILNGLDGLGTGGLTALLLLAPDAPLVPGAVLGQIDVNPLGDDDREQLFEVTGPPGPGPDRMVFGLVGDAFVVATDEEMARRGAELDTEELDEDAAGAVRVPVADLLQLEGAEGEAFAEVFDDLVATISADPDATVASAWLKLRD